MTLEVSDVELVDAAAGTYGPAGEPLIVDFGQAVRVFKTTRADGLNILAIEGTHDVIGWAVDFLALPMYSHIPFLHPDIGMVHAGFYASALAVLPQIRPLTAKPFALSGHSLGGALALLLAAILSKEGLPPVKVGAFGPPRAGGDAFVKIITGMPFCAYRNKGDPIPRVPFRLPPQFLYRNVPLTQYGRDEFEIDVFADHHIGEYVDAVHAIAGGNKGDA